MVLDNAPLECHQILNATPHGYPATHTNKARQAVVNSGIDVGPSFDVEVQTNFEIDDSDLRSQPRVNVTVNS